MSSSIDQRIVEMQFNNRQFESGVSETLSSLDKLKNSLDVLGSGEALQNLSDIDTSRMKSFSDSVETATGKFSVLEEIAIGALRRIGEMAVNAGTNLVRNLSNQLVFDNINAGWDKYAQKTEAVQTIMAATRDEFAADGNQMEKVTEQLEKLNWFTDETSYNFVDMTSNIGKFTSAGVGLEEATDAMMGISAWAAISGANVNQASHAMYNLSQAMGVGAVTMADWKSIENANMATMEFKETALETAAGMGQLIKVGEGLYKTLEGDEVTALNFRQTLTDSRWLNNEVLMETLKNYGTFASKLADGQSTIKAMTKDYADTTSELLKDIDKYIDGSLDLNEIQLKQGYTVEDLREQFDLLSSSEDELGRRAFKAAQEAKTFKEAIDSVKDAASTTWMNIFEDIFGDYEHAKVLWTDLANSLWDTFVGPLDNLETIISEWSSGGGNAFAIQGVINIWQSFASVIDAVAAGFASLFPEMTLEQRGQALIEFTKKFRDFTENLKPSEKTLEAITNTVKGLLVPFKAFFGILKQIVSFAFPPLLSLGGQILSLFVRLTGFLGSGLANGFNFITANVSKLTTVLGQVKNAIFGQLEEPIQRVKESIKKAFDSIFGKFEEFNIFGKLGEKITSFTDILVKSIAKWGFKNWFEGTFKTFGDNVANAFEKASDAIERYDIKGKINNIITNVRAAFEKAIVIFNKVKDAIIKFDVIGRITTLFNTFQQTITNVKEKIKAFIDAHERIKNIVDYFKRLKESIKENIKQYGFLTTAAAAVVTPFAAIGVAFSKVYEFLKTSGLLEMISNGFWTAYEKIKGFGTFLYNFFSPYVTAAIEKVKSFFENLKNFDTVSLGESFKKWKESIKTPKDLFNSLVEKLKSVKESIKGFFESLTSFDKVKAIFEKVTGWFSSIANTLQEHFKDKGFIGVFNEIIDVVRTLVAIGAGVVLAKFALSLTGFFDNLADFFKKNSRQPIAKTILEIAVAIGILAGAMWVIAQIPATELQNSIATMIGLFVMLGSMATLMTALNAIGGKGSNLMNGGGLLLMVGAVAAMVYVAKLIANSGLNFDTVKDNIESFIVVFGSLAVLMLVSKLAGKNAASFGAGMLLLSLAIEVIIHVIKTIAKMDPNDVAKGKKVVEELLAVFTVIMALSWLSGKNSAKAGSMLIKMSVAIGILSICIYALGKMDPSSVKRSARTIEELMGVMALVLAVSGLASKAAGAIGSMALVLIVLAGSLAALTYFDSGSIETNAKSLSIVLIALGVSMALMGKMGPNVKKALGTAAALFIIFAGIAVAMLALGQTDWQENIVNAVILSALMVVLVQVFKQFSKITATTKKMRSTAGTMALVLAAIAGSLFWLGQIDPVNNIINALALSAVLVVLVEVFKKMKTINASIGQCVIAAAMMGVILAEVSYALYKLNETDASNNLVNAIALSAVIGALGVAMKALSGFHMDILTAFTAVVMMGVILAEVGYALYKLNETDPINNLENAIALGVLLVALSGAMLILSHADFLAQITGAAGAVVGIAILLNGLAGVFWILGEWATSQRATIEAGIEMAKTVAHGLGEFVGNLITGVGDEISAKLPGYGESLSEFANNLSDFITVFSGVPDGFAGKVGGITGGILQLTAANFLDNIANWFSGIVGGHSMNEFGEQLNTFAGHFVGFVNTIKSVGDTAGVEAATSIIDTMIELATEIPNSGGLIGDIVGNNDIDDFGARLETFAEHFVNFVNKIKEVPDGIKEKAETVQAASECMLAVANAIPNTGGVVGDIVGNNDIDDFGERMATFAEHFVDFAGNIKDMPDGVKTDAETVQKAAECMVALANEIPNMGGALAAIVGDNDLATFGQQMMTFSIYFVKFADKIKDLPDGIKDKTESVEAAASILATFANTKIEKTGGLLQFFTGDNYQGLVDFGNGIAALGVGLGGYSDQLKTIDLAAVQLSFDLFKEIIEVAQMAMNTETGTLLNITNGMRNAGIAMISAFTSVFAGTDEAGVSTGMINAALSLFFTNVNTCFDQQKVTTTGYITQTLGPELVAAFDESMVTADLEAIGTRVVEDIENGIIAEQDPDATGVVEEMGELLTSTVEEILPPDVWYDVGMNAVLGLARGISEHTEAAVTAASSMASAVEAAAAVTLKVESPSRVFMKIGDYVVQGFARGITDNTGKATGAASMMAGNVIDKVTSLAAFIAAAIDDEMDISPVITPVLDMAGVESGVAGMDAMFGARNIGTVGISTPNGLNIQGSEFTKLTDTMQAFIDRAQNAQSAPINIYVTGGSNDSADDIANAVMDRLNVELQRRRAAMG